MNTDSKPALRAVYLDSYYGPQPISIRAFPTKRRGQRCIRFRLIAERGGWHSPQSRSTREDCEAMLRGYLTHAPGLFRVMSFDDMDDEPTIQKGTL